jgi:phospholipid/cholesterol/gamma-HCH transport system substrate-binding protein
VSRLSLVQRIQLALVAVAVVAAGFVVAGRWPEPGTAYAAVVSDASGVVPRNDVRLNDIVVGQVTGVDLEGLHAKIDFEIHDDVTVPAGTKVEIRQTSLLGEFFLALVPEGDGTLAPGTVIPIERTRRAAELESIVAQAGGLAAQVNIDNVNRILTSLDSGFAAGPDAVGDLFESMAGTASSLSALTGDLNATIDSIDTLSARLAPETGRFQAAVDRFAGGAEALARSNEGIDTLVDRLNAATGSLSGLLERNRDRLRRGTPVLRRTLDDVVAHLDELASTISGLPAFNRGWACAADGHYLNFMFPLAPEVTNIDLNPGRCDNVEEGPRGRKRPTEVQVLPGLDGIQVDDPIGTGNIDLGGGSANEGRDRLEEEKGG